MAQKNSRMKREESDIAGRIGFQMASQASFTGFDSRPRNQKEKGMKTIFIKINKLWVELERDEPQGNPALEISLGLLLLGFLVAAVALA